ncbi:MAG TPA: hypothetical protein VII75_10860 [Thermoanaerobaculia bacterium]|nr:hypothetical protein [Thermoanaerobaculia bacterium]
MLALLVTTTIKGEVLIDDVPVPGAVRCGAADSAADDAGGSPAPHKITLVDLSGVPRVTISDIDGAYHFENVTLPYTVTADMDGLRVARVRGTTIRMKSASVVVAGGGCEEWGCQPDPVQHAQYWVPLATRLPITRGITGLLELAPGVH